MPHFGGGAEGKVDVWNYDEGCGKCGVENLSAESRLRLARVKSRVPNRHSGLAGENACPTGPHWRSDRSHHLGGPT